MTPRERIFQPFKSDILKVDPVELNTGIYAVQREKDCVDRLKLAKEGRAAGRTDA